MPLPRTLPCKYSPLSLRSERLSLCHFHVRERERERRSKRELFFFNKKFPKINSRSFTSSSSFIRCERTGPSPLTHTHTITHTITHAHSRLPFYFIFTLSNKQKNENFTKNKKKTPTPTHTHTPTHREIIKWRAHRDMESMCRHGRAVGRRTTGGA